MVAFYRQNDRLSRNAWRGIGIAPAKSAIRQRQIGDSCRSPTLVSWRVGRGSQDMRSKGERR